MIIVNQLNGTETAVNAELIEQVISNPDTVIMLTTGNNILVRESMQEVLRKIMDYRRTIILKNKIKEKKKK